MFCTTKLNLDIIISLNVKEKFSFHKNAKIPNNMTVFLTTKIDSELSAQIDYDEINIEREVASGGFGKKISVSAVAKGSKGPCIRRSGVVWTCRFCRVC